MDTQNSVLHIKEYGKITLKLNKVLDEKGFTRNYLSRMTNTRFEVIDRWYNGNVEKLDLDVLARICYVLECNINDILEYSDK